MSATTSDIVIDAAPRPAAWLIRAYIACAISFGAMCLLILVGAH